VAEDSRDSIDVYPPGFLESRRADINPAGRLCSFSWSAHPARAARRDGLRA
jgi:hypothetical protein